MIHKCQDTTRDNCFCIFWIIVQCVSAVKSSKCIQILGKTSTGMKFLFSQSQWDLGWGLGRESEFKYRNSILIEDMLYNSKMITLGILLCYRRLKMKESFKFSSNEKER